MSNKYDSIKKYLPSKVIAGEVAAIKPLESWMYDDGMGDPWWQGAGGVSFRWIIDVTTTASSHSSHLTREPFLYNALDITPGMWVMAANDPKALRVVSIISKDSQSISCIVEDVNRFNTFKDQSSAGSGIFGVPSSLIFFQLGDDGLPILDPLPVVASDPAVVSQVEARFRVFNPNTEVQFYQVNHGFVEGTVLKLNGITKMFEEASSDDIYIVGTVTAVGPGPNYFYLAPSTKFLLDLSPSLPGSAGSIIWIDPTTSQLTTTPNVGKAPMYIQMNDPVATFTIGLVDNPNSWDGIQFSINKTLITLSGADPINTSEILAAINSHTAEHGCVATMSAPATLVTGSVGFPSTGVDGSLQFTVNGTLTTVATPSIVFGDSGQIGWWDIVRSVNEQSHSHGVYVTMDPDNGWLIFSRADGGPINFQNVSPTVTADGLTTFTDLVGVSAINPAGVPTRLKLERADGGEIIIANVAGDFTGDTGLQSAANGKMPVALIVDKSIGSTGNYVVADISARDAMTNLRTGDQVFVQDSGNGEWALFVKTSSTWTLIADQDSANTDANTLTATINSDDTAPLLVGTISDQSRVVNVVVVVEEAFDSETAALSIGDDTVVDAVMRASGIDLAVAGTYEATSEYENTTGGDVSIFAHLFGGGATKGTVKVMVSYL